MMMSFEEQALTYFRSIDFTNPYLICTLDGTDVANLRYEICKFLVAEGLLAVDHEKSILPTQKWFYITDKGRAIHKQI
jgi:hypothetical protein